MDLVESHVGAPGACPGGCCRQLLRLWASLRDDVVVTSRDNPAFAAFYAGLSRAAERGSIARLRRKTLESARGRLLIVGAGQAHDIAHLPQAVESVVALEPDSAMRRWGEKRLRRSAAPASYVAGTAEHLPLCDRSVDTVLCTLVLCSVDDLDAAAAEFRRVLKPDGELLVLEHVRGDCCIKRSCDLVTGNLPVAVPDDPLRP